MMRELLRKDWRVYRTAVVGGTVLAACPYAVILSMQVMYPPGSGNTLRTYGGALEKSATAGMLLTLLMAAVFGGIAFAAERRDRSAEFVAMLPVRRWPVVLSKLMIAVACLVLMAAVHIAIGLTGSTWRNQPEFPLDAIGHMLASLVTFASLVGLLFGLAWMLSVYLDSPAIAATVAIGVAVVLIIVVNGIVTGSPEYVLRDRFGDEWAAVTFVSLAVGSLALVISTVNYVRRVTP